MSQEDRARIDDANRNIRETYGPILNRADLAAMLKMTQKSADNWAVRRGLAARRVGPGRYASRDVATALILGACV